MTNAKSLDTLIEDVYSTLTHGYADSQAADEIVEAFGNGLKDLLKSRLRPRKKSEGVLRLSAIGKPARQLWYESKGYDREELTGDKLLKFLYGDIIEEVLLTLIKLSGHTVTNMQQKVKVAGVVGHIDAVIDGHIVDVKSASATSFAKFEKATLVFDDPFGYMQQISAYSKGVENKGAAFLAMNKVDGRLTLFEPSADMLPDTEERVAYLKEVIAKDTPPERCYEPVLEKTSGNMKLSMGCTFCDFKKDCWKNANGGSGLRGFNYSFGTVFYVHVNKTPRVDEVALG